MALQHYKEVLEYLEVHSGLSMETTRNVWFLLGTLTAQVGQCENLSLFVHSFSVVSKKRVMTIEVKFETFLNTSFIIFGSRSFRF